MKVPTGFIAICQCDKTIGALDYSRTDRKEAGQIIGEWLSRGCTVKPMFESHWSANIGICKCIKDGE